jgi:TonB family protein
MLLFKKWKKVRLFNTSGPFSLRRRIPTWWGLAFILSAVVLYGSTPPYVGTRFVCRAVDVSFYVLVAIGITLLLWPEIAELDEVRLQGEARATFRLSGKLRLPLKRLTVLTTPLASLRMFSYVAFMVLLVPAITFWILQPLTPQGLLVYVPKQGTLPASDGLRGEPVVLRITTSRNLYLNHSLMNRRDVARRLREALGRGPGWTVYLDGAPDIPFADIAIMTDEIQRELAAKVVLVTPSVKKEDPRLDGSTPCEHSELYKTLLKPSREWADGYAYWSPSSTYISFSIDERGEVSSVKVWKQSANSRRDAALVRQIQKWRFKPLPGCGTETFWLAR